MPPIDLYRDANGLPNWDYVIIDVVDCGCCPLDTEAAQLTLEFIEEMDYTKDTPEVRNTIDTVYNAFKWAISTNRIKGKVKS